MCRPAGGRGGGRALALRCVSAVPMAHKMHLVLIVWILAAAAARAGVARPPAEACGGVVVRGVPHHERRVLRAGLDRPYQLAADRAARTLYFSYSASPDDDEFRAASLQLDTGELRHIDGVRNGFAQAVDGAAHVVYIGGSDGVYSYSRDTNRAEFVGDRNVDIWSMHFKDVLYYSTFPSQVLYTLVDGVSARVQELEDTKVDSFVIDKDDVMFFTNASGLYSQKKGAGAGAGAAVSYGALPAGVRALATDVAGAAHVCLQDGVYAARAADASLEKLVDVEDAFGVAFDADNNIVYADSTSLVRLEPNKDKSCI